MEKENYTMHLIGWKAFYEKKTYSSEEGHSWKSIPRNGMILLQKFFKIYDKDGSLYTKDGEDTFYEIVYGHSIISLSVEDLKSSKNLTKEIKFMGKASQEEIEKLKNIIERKNETISS